MAWSFDLRTAILIGALVIWLVAGVLLLSWPSLPKAVRPSLRWWLAGITLHPLGAALTAFRGILPDWLSVAVGGVVVTAAFACMSVAMRSFYGLTEHRLRLALITLLLGSVVVLFTFIVPSLQLRIVTVHLLLGLVLAIGARAVFRRGGPRGRMPRVTAALFALVALLVFVRAGAELHDPTSAQALLRATPVNLASLGSLLVLPLLATVGFLLMCTEYAQEAIERTARTDYLTGIFNRRAIEDLSARAISAARRHGTPLAIMIIDVDHFKQVNDEHGHECGDNALIEVVRRIREIVRNEDLVGRQGGEEFVVVMPDVGLASAKVAAERLRQSFSDHATLIHDGDRTVELPLTLSVGVAGLELGDQQFSHLLRRADRAMYAAKSLGRNRVTVVDSQPA